MAGKTARLKYHCVEVIAPKDGCDAARALRSVRILSADAPRLPLATCDHPATCECTYRHFDDRRQETRREDEVALLRPAHKGPERRKRPGRRDNDYR